jgi:hypothetical protein
LEGLMSTATTESLRSANRNLRARLARLLPELNPSAPLNPQDLSGVVTDLLHAGDCLRSISPVSVPDAELKEAISEYRSTVEQLAQILPRVHGRLLTEKARLEIARAHVTATAAWAQASQNTL